METTEKIENHLLSIKTWSYFQAGADLGFSRGGGGFSNKFRNFCRPFFFLGGPNWFFELSLSLFSLYFGQIFCAAGKILKKQSKKGIFRDFLENVDEKIAFFRRALPP